MAPLTKVLVHLSLLLFLFSCVIILSVPTQSHQLHTQKPVFTRKLLALEDFEEEEEEQPKKKSTTFSSSNTKLTKPNQTKTKLANKSSTFSAKNQTKLSKPSNSTKLATSLPKSDLKKLNSSNSLLKLKKINSTSSLKLKKLNSTKLPSLSSKLTSPKNKTTPTTQTQPTPEKKQLSSETPKPKNTAETKAQKQKPKKQAQPSWIDDDNLVSEFRDLPSRFQRTLIPDLQRISTTSKAYINRYNKEMTNQFKPIVGNKHAPTIATAISFAFILIPLVLVSLVFKQIKAYFSLQKVLIFIQVYLSIYFSILCISSLATGLEPLRFFYATSRSTYVCLQVLQTLAYVLYLLLLLMYLVLVFSTKSGLGSKLLGLGQTFVGFAVGLHYYVAVFHRVVLREPPKTNWKIHGIYATCFLLVSVCANAERRKKGYMEESGEEGKVN